MTADDSSEAARKSAWTPGPSGRETHHTREAADDLAAFILALRRRGIARRDAAGLATRCTVVMFACGLGVLPQERFCSLLQACRTRPERFAPSLQALWAELFGPAPATRSAGALPGAGEVDIPERAGEACGLLNGLARAAQRPWAEIDPSILGHCMEESLESGERRRLGLYFTPRAPVDLLVQATVTEPLRADWRTVADQMRQMQADGRDAAAQALAARFHASLQRVRVLDPACGAGAFLYVALAHVQALEAEVLDAMARLGCRAPAARVGPRQFLGLEVDPQAAALARLALWIADLQGRARACPGQARPAVPSGCCAIRVCDAILAFDGRARRGPRRPEWPQADFIVGNPPFMGGKDLRARLGDAYAEALWAAHPQMNRAADLVMYWWDHAADILTRPGSRLRRFGFVTTNSIAQARQRRTLTRWLDGPRPLHLAMAMPDHPWGAVASGGAAVRVSMTVAAAGRGTGVLLQAHEGVCDSPPAPALRRTAGRINADLTLGLDLTAAKPLLANRGLCSPGVKLHGAGFIVTLEQARALGLGWRRGLEAYILPYRHGRDLMQMPRGAWVIDLYPLAAEAVRTRFPEVYQHLLATVKPHRDANRMAFRRERWWWFGATHETYRGFTAGLGQYIATPETAKHRVFTFLERGVRADNMVAAFGLSDAFHLGVLSARPHLAWARATGAMLEDRPRYTKSACFDPFPFPDPPEALRDGIGAAAEALDLLRRQLLAETPGLTLTALYNRLADPSPGAVDRGVSDLRQLHARLDALVEQAYGWPVDLSEADLLHELARLNAARVREEADGRVRWLRTDYQTARRAPSRPREEPGPPAPGESRPSLRVA